MYLFYFLDTEFDLFYSIGNLMANKNEQYNYVSFESKSGLSTFMEDIYSNSNYDDLLIDDLMISSF